ncbi:hypothetical protein A6C57_18725 [Fibrella sp. ES10-3-2-2]|nr:hypothetical protein A6C57_18725 [Fibrella sp. ES10-3-2-2]
MYPAYTLPVWLADEQQLRDEAVLFGLSEARPDEKIAAIRLAFAALTAPLEKQIEQHHEAIDRLTLLLEATTAQAPPPPAAVDWSGGWPVGKFLVGFLATSLLTIGTYLGTLPVIDTPIALLLAGLTGSSGCLVSLFVCQASYREAATVRRNSHSQADELHKQQAANQVVWQQQKQSEVDHVYLVEAELNRQNARRDLLIRLFESEFDLARSLRHQLRDRYVDL